MLKKIREGEKGFTLVELLAVIVILGIIVAIAIPAIGSVIERAGDNAENAEETLVLDAARLYEVEHGKIDTEDGITVEDLIEGDYLDRRQGEGLSGTIKRNADDELEANLDSALDSD